MDGYFRGFETFSTVQLAAMTLTSTHASDIPRTYNDRSARHPSFDTLGTCNRCYALRRVFCREDKRSDYSAHRFAYCTLGRRSRCDDRRQICIHPPWEHSSLLCLHLEATPVAHLPLLIMWAQYSRSRLREHLP